MARSSIGPWLRKGRGWYVKIQGRQVPLGGAELTRPQAVALWREALARHEAEQVPGAPQPELSFGEVCTAYLRWLDGRKERGEVRASTYEDAVRRLADAPDRLGQVPVERLRPHDVELWLNAPERAEGRTTRYDRAAQLRRVTRWAYKQGLVERDPLDRFELPPAPRRRQLTVDPATWGKFFAEIKSPGFRDFVSFIYWTGCRPGEAARIEARHVVSDYVELPPEEHKTGEATGHYRLIELVPEARELLARLAVERPRGPLFVNARGNPWTRWAWKDQIRRIRERSGLGNEVMASALRHLFATDLLQSGASLAVVAAALGHSTTAMVSRTYGRMEARRDPIREAIAKARKALPQAPEQN